MIIPRHYENLHVLHENTAANRSYYIPLKNGLTIWWKTGSIPDASSC